MNNYRIIQETPPYIRQDYVVIWSNEIDAKGQRPFNLNKQSVENTSYTVIVLEVKSMLLLEFWTDRTSAIVRT